MEEVSRQKRAELAGTAGAGVLGAGLGVLVLVVWIGLKASIVGATSP